MGTKNVEDGLESKKDIVRILSSLAARPIIRSSEAIDIPIEDMEGRSRCTYPEDLRKST